MSAKKRGKPEELANENGVRDKKKEAMVSSTKSIKEKESRTLEAGPAKKDKTGTHEEKCRHCKKTGCGCPSKWKTHGKHKKKSGAAVAEKLSEDQIEARKLKFAAKKARRQAAKAGATSETVEAASSIAELGPVAGGKVKKSPAKKLKADAVKLKAVEAATRMADLVSGPAVNVGETSAKQLEAVEVVPSIADLEPDQGGKAGKASSKVTAGSIDRKRKLGEARAGALATESELGKSRKKKQKKADKARNAIMDVLLEGGQSD
jgi:hypothetical protein